MTPLEGYQRKYLRGLAHGLNPVVTVGQKGVTESLIKEMDEALDRHELIKLKFVEFKEKESKQEIVEVLLRETACELVGMIGHTAIFYRMHGDPEMRRIQVPTR